jgi:hypothetical protein
MRPYGRGATATGLGDGADIGRGVCTTGRGAGAIRLAIDGTLACVWIVELEEKLGKFASESVTVLGSGGNVGPSTRRTAERRTGAAFGSRLIGDGRAGKSSRCALPTMAFFVTPSRRPISAVE